MTLLSEHGLDHTLRSLDPCRVERRLLTQAYLLFPQFIQHFRGGNRLQPLVFDAANQRFLFHDENDDLAGSALLLLNTDIIEHLHRVQRLDIAPDHVHVKPVVRLRLQIEFDGVGWDSAVASDLHVFDSVRIGSLQRLWPHTTEHESQQNGNDHFTPPKPGILL